MVKNIFVLAVPSTLSVFLEIVMEVINTLFIGRLGDATMMAALGIAHVIFNLLTLIPIMGANTALESFVSQAYGAKDLRECGNYLNRGRIVVFAVYIPSMVITLNCENILVAMKQDP